MKDSIKVPFIIDAHLDLATNAMTMNRDLTKTVQEIRDKESELGWKDYQDRGNGTVAFPELRNGNVGLVLATMISRYSENGSPLHTMALPGWHSPQQAYAHAQCQLAWYREMEVSGEMVQITTKDGLESHFNMWTENTDSLQKKPVGYILALEGADSIVNLDYLHTFHEQGLRSIGISHFGPGRYAAGTHSDGSGLTVIGKELLKEMNQLPMQLDLTHLTDKGFYEALDIFQGTVIASHQNCRSIVPGERQFSDDQIKCIIERDGMLGGALDTWMMYPDFQLGKDDPKKLKIGMELLVDHFDHICQMAGNSKHIGFGSDLDGLFGLEQTPYDIDNISDLQKFSGILRKRGYTSTDIENIFYKNWTRTLNRILT
ncbi:membrane dipeptidase [Aurantibacter crassamenti]|uniref:dipeptidase n=1 Tax=Aurantibacter crassamenti TaxID=1837375 RepID=UPI0019399E5E|nr:membrane dipeptidase [Aurantibacter crassamenti]MBM1105049.1 membrane dipeptidase [Aurantibacter crassamenti]